MVTTDPIADLLTRIRNANTAGMEKVEIPMSKIKLAIVDILKREGYIRNYRAVEEKGKQTIRVYLKYGPRQERVIHSLRRISKPSVRRYAGKDKMPKVKGGLGICIISTPQGVLTDQEARKRGVGGELLCEVY